MNGTTTAEEGRRSSNLELFLDLVFVFAVTQVTRVIEAGADWPSFIHGVLLAWLVWWMWSQLVWLGTAVDLEHNTWGQLVVIAAVVPTLLMAVAVPTAQQGGGPAFGVSYLIAQVVALVAMGSLMRHVDSARQAFVRYAGLAVGGPVLVFVAGFVGTPGRQWLWLLGALFGIGGALLTGRVDRSQMGWSIDPTHFAERHSLFVIIALGEVLVGIGAVATERGVTAEVVVGLAATVAVACALWWIYFAYLPRLTEERLRRVQFGDRASVARNLFTFGHFPVVLGVILYAIVAEHVTAHPTEHLHSREVALLGAAVVLFVGSLMAFHWTYNRGVAPERVVAIAGIAVLLLVAGERLDPRVLVASVAAVLAVMHLVTVARLATRLAANEPSRSD